MDRIVFVELLARFRYRVEAVTAHFRFVPGDRLVQ